MSRYSIRLRPIWLKKRLCAGDTDSRPSVLLVLVKRNTQCLTTILAYKFFWPGLDFVASAVGSRVGLSNRTLLHLSQIVAMLECVIWKYAGGTFDCGNLRMQASGAVVTLRPILSFLQQPSTAPSSHLSKPYREPLACHPRPEHCRAQA